MVETTESPALLFLGTLPPPVNGQNLATRVVLDHAARHMRVDAWNLSEAGRNVIDLRSRLWKAGRVALGLLWLLTRRRGGEGGGGGGKRGPRSGSTKRDGGRQRLYIVANSRHGLWYDLLIAVCARVRGDQLIVHHQVYSYLTTRDRRMALLNRLMGPEGVHVMLCPAMARRFRELYHPPRRILEVANTIILLNQTGTAPADAGEREAEARDHQETPRVLRLGHLSNLTLAKGLDLVLETFARLHDQTDGAPMPQLVLAGPCGSGRERSLINAVRERFAEQIDYRGPVYGLQKQRFFRDIDVLLFPTRYLNEAQPLTIAEALGAGVAVVAYGRGCIAQQVGDAGLVVPPENDFIEPAVKALYGWREDEEALEAVRRRARERGQRLRREAAEQLEQLINLFTGEG